MREETGKALIKNTLKDIPASELRKQAEEVAWDKADRSPEEMRRMLQELQVRQTELEKQNSQTTIALRERIKELSCINAISILLFDSETPLKALFEEAVRLIPAGWYYPELTCARITLEEQMFITDNFRETPWKLASDMVVSGRKVGSLEVFLLEEKDVGDRRPFLKEEEALIDNLARKFGLVAERRREAEELQHYRSRLEELVEQRTRELVRSNEQLVNMQAEQMRINHLASIGELAAGVAHEINNPINGIINYAQIIVNTVDPESRGYDIAKKIIKEGERIAFIVSSLLSFSRQREEEKIPVTVGQILADTLDLVETQIKKNGIDLRIEMDSAEYTVNVHLQQIQQVFLNIINNARYSLNVKYPAPHPDKIFLIMVRKITIQGEPSVQIVFEDHGTGIPDHLIDKIMNPFYTTKPTGFGTGLGLSISHGIIIDHNGSLTVESREGVYARIIITLPVNGRAV